IGQVRYHRRPRVRHRGNRGQAGGANPAWHAVLCRQHHPWRRQRHPDPGSERHRAGGQATDRRRRARRRSRQCAGRDQGRDLVPAVQHARQRTQGRSAGTGRAPRGSRRDEHRARRWPSCRAVPRPSHVAGPVRRPPRVADIRQAGGAG
ncbi:hypothetical protein OY671_012594, partial [Metschnikowia pulcherrima]